MSLENNAFNKLPQRTRFALRWAKRYEAIMKYLAIIIFSIFSMSSFATHLQTGVEVKFTWAGMACVGRAHNITEEEVQKYMPIVAATKKPNPNNPNFTIADMYGGGACPPDIYKQNEQLIVVVAAKNDSRTRLFIFDLKTDPITYIRTTHDDRHVR